MPVDLSTFLNVSRSIIEIPETVHWTALSPVFRGLNAFFGRDSTPIGQVAIRC